MRKLLLLIVLLVVGCSDRAVTPAPVSGPLVQSVDAYLRIYGGSAGVYRSLVEETSCAELQRAFYTATQNNTLGYQVAADDRAQDLGCPLLRFTPTSSETVQSRK